VRKHLSPPRLTGAPYGGGAIGALTGVNLCRGLAHPLRVRFGEGVAEALAAGVGMPLNDHDALSHKELDWVRQRTLTERKSAQVGHMCLDRMRCWRRSEAGRRTGM
jgi:hypothetical protein